MKESVAAVMPKGSVVYWDGQTYHAGGANSTVDQRRFGVTVDYCSGFLRTQENFIVAVGDEKAATFPEDLQQLIGYKISKGGLGHIYTDNPQGMQRKVRTGDKGDRKLNVAAKAAKL